MNMNSTSEISTAIFPLLKQINQKAASLLSGRRVIGSGTKGILLVAPPRQARRAIALALNSRQLLHNGV